MDREARIITISVNIYIYGKDASDDLASKYKDSIMDTWGSFQDFTMDGESYSILWDVDVTNLGDENVNLDFAGGKNNYFNIDSDAATSSVIESRTGILRPFGHLLGLSDKYGTDNNDKKTYRKALDGYGGNVMAEEAGMGVVEPMNIESALYPVTHSKSKRRIYYLNRYNAERTRK